MKIKTTLFQADEALAILNGYADTRFPGTGSSISMKIFDMSDAMSRKVEFLSKETRKIAEAYGVVPMGSEPNSPLAALDADGNVDEKKTGQFVDEVVALRSTEIELDIPALFTMAEVRDHLPLSAVEYGKIRFLIAKEEEKDSAEPEIIIS